MLVSKILLFRRKYGISRSELGAASGLSKQRIYEFETTVGYHMPATVEKLCHGLETIIERRKAGIASLSSDLEKHKTSLLDYVEENSYEL